MSNPLMPRKNTCSLERNHQLDVLFHCPSKDGRRTARLFGLVLYLLKMDLDRFPAPRWGWEALVMRLSKCLIIQSGGDPFSLLFKTS